jgi:hypothetical protein
MMLTATPMSRPLCAAAQLAAPRLLSSGVSERVTHLKRYDWSSSKATAPGRRRGSHPSKPAASGLLGPLRGCPGLAP